MQTIVRASFVFSLFAIACTGVTEPSASIDSDYTVQPNGGAAALLVTVPPGASLTPTVTAQRDKQPAQNITLGSKAALSAGSYCIQTKLSLGKIPHAVDRCAIPITAGATTTFAFGTLTFTRTTDATVIGIDLPFGPAGYYSPLEQPTSLLSLLREKALVPYPPGPFAVDSFFAGTLADGEGRQLEVDSPTDRYALEILPPNPATRTLPDLPTKFGIAFGTYGLDVYRISTGKADALTERFTRMDKRHFWAKHGAYGQGQGPRLAVFGTARTSAGVTAYESGILLNAQKQLQTYKFGRLEVADVSVTMLDGAKVSVPGTFSVYGNLTSLVAGAPTGHGIDVPEGKYSVHVTYTSPIDGTLASYDEEVTVTN